MTVDRFEEGNAQTCKLAIFCLARNLAFNVDPLRNVVSRRKQEAEVGELDTSRNWRSVLSLTCARRLKRRAQVKLGGLRGGRCLAREPHSPTRRARGGQKDVGYKNGIQPVEVRMRGWKPIPLVNRVSD